MRWKELFQADSEAMFRLDLTEQTFPEGTKITASGGRCDACGAVGGVYRGAFLRWGVPGESYAGDPWCVGVASYCRACKAISPIVTYRAYMYDAAGYLPHLRRRLIGTDSAASASVEPCPNCGQATRRFEDSWDDNVDRWEDHAWVVCVNSLCGWDGRHAYNSGSYLMS